MLNTVRFNIFQGDGDSGSGNAQALVEELLEVTTGVIGVVSVLPSQQGSFDVTIVGATRTLQHILEHYEVPALDADWGTHF